MTLPSSSPTMAQVVVLLLQSQTLKHGMPFWTMELTIATLEILLMVQVCQQLQDFLKRPGTRCVLSTLAG